ncbi:beta-ketoacyl-[acyl-carrier-protein] synthase family protein [Fodinicola acaciae]|uniref:beta-ketoacyl-[acyl-carrier-protein] synthase family protein n=1 Tax=Fodinicola acaciae TaxID=2681555 RepID=UPI0013D451F2|nr:beta-ketoacyl-[acyl-carrier-protein] synthase family protein [Fodinicola acaciae]
MTATGRPDRRRVAVTGAGVRAPAGADVESVFAAMLKGESLAAPVPELAAAELPVTFACTVPPPPAMDDYFPPREQRKTDRATQLAVAAARDAYVDAGLTEVDPDRAGVSVGSAMGGISSTEEAVLSYGASPGDYPAFTVARIMPNSPAARIALQLGFRGPCTTHVTACASGTDAIGAAAQKIRHGELDCAIAGGVDTPVTVGIMASFGRLRALSSRVDDPAAASRPFDADRDGFVMAEGATFLVLEDWDLAQRRGARIYGEIAGYASNCDAFHIVAPAAEGVVAARCMTTAIADAGLTPAGVGHVNAHGTSTVLNDRAESAALLRVFGSAGPPVTAPKSVVGHMMGGAGAYEALVALLSASRGVVPPVANFSAPGIEEPIDVVAGEARLVGPAPALSNSFGFGGHNACLVLVPAR